MIGSYADDGELTPQLRRVLIAVARGETAQETARKLYRSHKTIECERRALVRRLGARNLPNAVLIAAQQGLLDHIGDDTEPG